MNKFKLNKKLLLSVSLFFSLIFLFADSSYKVQKGDTLSEIAAKYNTTYFKLAELNNMSNPNLIYPGQKILIKANK